ncbi:hypothetical protein AYK26_04740 [Euryarchaeota archaeon SM23-78]|nr:MAG: hypothetical protein AYK26_04740 [Euryarchaeota archaeon SM23-78]
MRLPMLLLILFTLFGIFLLKGGITSFTIAENCCFPPDCPPEDMCSEVSATFEAPATLTLEDSSALTITGVLIIFISLFMMGGYFKRRIDEIKEESKQEEPLKP